ncbi:MAG: CRISPR-associated protein Csx20 [Desulfobacula sp.]|nr:CRISPR-associated protein Csx20 [Desulfobacula sp.]
MVSMTVLLNHTISDQQKSNATENLNISKFTLLPPDLKKKWGNIPPNVEGVDNFLLPFKQWVENKTQKNDYILIQGDFGATFLMVQFAFEKKLIPVYATSERKAFESVQEDGAVKMEHLFKFCRFRRYGM